MKSEPCIICGNAAEIHIDERRNRHVSCPTCGGYIAAEAFAPQYHKLDESVREAFAAWMISSSDKRDRYLHKTRPLKNNPYCAAEGFNLISISRIQSGTYNPENAERKA